MTILARMLIDYGTAPLLIVLSFLVGYLIQQIRENGKKDEERAKELRSTIHAQISSVESNFLEKVEQQQQKNEEMCNRIASVERDYLTREEHYKVTGGWRTEINRLVDLIIKREK